LSDIAAVRETRGECKKPTSSEVVGLDACCTLYLEDHCPGWMNAEHFTHLPNGIAKFAMQKVSSDPTSSILRVANGGEDLASVSLLDVGKGMWAKGWV
jgi:hypothetical protein